MKGVRIIEMASHCDSRGCLVVPDSGLLPFTAPNFFYIHDVPAHASRDHHSSASDEALVVVQGALKVDLDNGSEQARHHLADAERVLCVHAGVHLRLHHFSASTILFAMASRPYDRASKLDRPQPELLEPCWPEDPA